MITKAVSLCCLPVGKKAEVYLYALFYLDPFWFKFVTDWLNDPEWWGTLSGAAKGSPTSHASPECLCQTWNSSVLPTQISFWSDCHGVLVWPVQRPHHSSTFGGTRWQTGEKFCSAGTIPAQFHFRRDFQTCLHTTLHTPWMDQSKDWEWQSLGKEWLSRGLWPSARPATKSTLEGKMDERQFVKSRPRQINLSSSSDKTVQAKEL